MLKINKASARKKYNQGFTIFLMPSKLALNNPWITPCSINNSVDGTFDFKVDSYSFYNCNNAVGNTVAYYIDN